MWEGRFRSICDQQAMRAGRHSIYFQNVGGILSREVWDVHKKEEDAMRQVILGGGLSAVSSAYFLQDREDIDEVIILEKDDAPGGLMQEHKKGCLYL